MKSFLGAIFVALAAILWATDNLVRYPDSTVIDLRLIVFSEHLLAVVFFLPIVFLKGGVRLFRLSLKEWLGVAVLGVGGAALATVFYSWSVLQLGVSLPMLIQKFQPFIVVVLAYFVLRERPKLNFFPWTILAILCAMLIGFPATGFRTFSDGSLSSFTGFLAAFSAMVLWALSTVYGKFLLNRLSVEQVTFLRFAAGSVALGVLVVATDARNGFGVMFSQFSFNHILSFAYLSLVPGLFAFWLYYKGLQRIPASIATFVELLFPLAGIVLNVAFGLASITFFQATVGLLLLFSVLLIAIPRTRH